MGESHAPDPPIVDHRRVRSCLCLPWEDTTDTLQNTRNTETNMKYQLRRTADMLQYTTKLQNWPSTEVDLRAVSHWYYEKAVELII